VNTVNSIVRQHYRQSDLAQGIVAEKKTRRRRDKNQQITVHNTHVEIKSQHDAVTITQYIYTDDK
jgi:hypothetical protein